MRLHTKALYFGSGRDYCRDMPWTCFLCIWPAYDQIEPGEIIWGLCSVEFYFAKPINYRLIKSGDSIWMQRWLTLRDKLYTWPRLVIRFGCKDHPWSTRRWPWQNKAELV